MVWCGRRGGGVRAADVWVPGNKMLPRCAPAPTFSPRAASTNFLT